MIQETRQAIATALGQINGLRTSATVPDNPNIPMAWVEPSGITYDTTFGRGMNEYDYDITVVVGRMADIIGSQVALDAYADPSNAKSVKRAVELDRTLGGLVQDCRVTGLTSYGQTSFGDATYLAAVFAVKVYS
jgi:hypothetical protein